MLIFHRLPIAPGLTYLTINPQKLSLEYLFEPGLGLGVVFDGVFGGVLATPGRLRHFGPIFTPPRSSAKTRPQVARFF